MKSITLVDGDWYRCELKAATGRDLDARHIGDLVAACKDNFGSGFLRAVFYDGQADDALLHDLSDRPEKKADLEQRRVQLAQFSQLERVELRTGRVTLRKRGNGLEQKGVDLLIGLDAAYYSMSRTVDRILFVSGDTDLVPAMDFARRQGVHVWAVQPPRGSLSLQILGAVDVATTMPIWAGT